MSILKITVLLQILFAHAVGISKDGNKSIKEFIKLKIGKLLKTLKLSKSRNSIGKKLSKF